MVEKQASSEIAQSRFDREELKRLIGEAVKYDLTRSDNPRLWLEMKDALDYAENHVAAAERDTRERCAQIAEHFLDELTAEEFPPHGLNKASMRWDSGHSEQFVKWIAERILGKE